MIGERWVSLKGVQRHAPVRKCCLGLFCLKDGTTTKKICVLSFLLLLLLFLTSTALADTIFIQRTGTETSEICFNNFDCRLEFYCEKAVGDCIGEGVCTLAPECSTCPYYFWPVCGCDGITYAGDCWAACIGVSVAYPGPCISKCLTWDDVIKKYWAYTNGQASWPDVITCYNQYTSQ
jgi:hypothetical protein